MNSTKIPQGSELHRKICVKKDVLEVRQWVRVLEHNSVTIAHFIAVEKQLINQRQVSESLLGIRRKNTLFLAQFCKYEMALKNEFEYGKIPYNEQRALVHEKHRNHYKQILGEYEQLHELFFQKLLNLKNI